MMARAGLLACFALVAAQDPASDAWPGIAPLFSPPAELKDDLGAYRSVMKFRSGRPVRSAAEWAERRREILGEWHELLGPWPPLIEKPRITHLGKEAVENFTRHKVDIQVAPDRTTVAYLLIPDGGGPFPAVLDVFYYPEDGAGLKPEKRRQNDFGYQLAKRGFVALCVGQKPWIKDADLYYPSFEKAQLQPLSYLAYVSANCHTLLASLPEVDPKRIGVVGHSYGGKWSMFAGALWEKFAAVAISDPGIVFDEKRSNVNYWEPWYLGHEPGKEPRKRGLPDAANPRTGPYKRMVEAGRDLHELHALIAPRPFLVSGGSEDKVERWKALNHTIALNRLLGFEGRVGLSLRDGHAITPEASDQIRLFFEHFLKRRQ